MKSSCEPGVSNIQGSSLRGRQCDRMEAETWREVSVVNGWMYPATSEIQVLVALVVSSVWLHESMNFPLSEA